MFVKGQFTKIDPQYLDEKKFFVQVYGNSYLAGFNAYTNIVFNTSEKDIIFGRYPFRDFYQKDKKGEYTLLSFRENDAKRFYQNYGATICGVKYKPGDVEFEFYEAYCVSTKKRLFFQYRKELEEYFGDLDDVIVYRDMMVKAR